MPSLAIFLVALITLTSSVISQRSHRIAREKRQLCVQVLNPANTQAIVDQCVKEIGIAPRLFIEIRDMVERIEKQNPTQAEATATRRRVVQMLAEAGQPLALMKYTECIHSKLGYMSNGAIDMHRLRAMLLRMAVGTPVEGEVRAALAACLPVEGIEVSPFLSCVVQSCINAQQ